MAKQTVPPLPLPKNWPQKVRSAAVHAIALARLALTTARGQANSANPGSGRIARLTEEILLIKEEMRIKDARMASIHAQRRPHYVPTERLAILELRAARGWSQAQTADHMLVTPATIASWMSRLDEEGPAALVQMPVPVNKFPAFVGYLVRRLKVLCSTMGKTRIANVLCRAGLHLSATTVGRMLRERPRWEAVSKSTHSGRRIRAKEPDHLWNVDLSTVPTAMVLWCAWLPWALPQRWPFCWWIAVAVDHFSRRVMGFAVFEQQPTSAAVRAFLGRAIRAARSRSRPAVPALDLVT